MVSKLFSRRKVPLIDIFSELRGTLGTVSQASARGEPALVGNCKWTMRHVYPAVKSRGPWREFAQIYRISGHRAGRALRPQLLLRAVQLDLKDPLCRSKMLHFCFLSVPNSKCVWTARF